MKRSITLNAYTLGGIVVLAVLVVGVALAIAQRSGTAATDAAVDSIVKEGDHVTAGELARWVLEKRQDYQLVDIREPWHFDDYHIPTAINIPFPELMKDAGLKRLDRNKKIVVYSLGAGHAAQTQLLLAMKGYKAYSLNDGIIAWWDEVMTPASVRSASPSSTGYQQAKQLREFFMTGVRASAAPGVTMPPPAPIVAAPAPAAPVAAAPVAAAPQPAKAAAPKAAPKAAAKPAAPPAAASPAAPEKKSPPPEEQRLKLGTGCS
jgi:rhodanese-related sulfurtransferase